MNTSNNLNQRQKQCSYCYSIYYTETCPNLPCKQNKYKSPDSQKMKSLVPFDSTNQYRLEIDNLRLEVEKLKISNPYIEIRDINKGSGELSTTLNDQINTLPSTARLEISKGNFNLTTLNCNTYKNITIIGSGISDTFIDGLIINGKKGCDLRLVISNCFLSYIQIKAQNCKIHFYYKDIDLHGKISLKEKKSIIEISKLI